MTETSVHNVIATADSDWYLIRMDFAIRKENINHNYVLNVRKITSARAKCESCTLKWTVLNETFEEWANNILTNHTEK